MGLMSVSEAEAAILARAPAVRVEQIPLDEAAGRVLAQEILADRDYPPINRATMDGIAVKASGATAWRIEAIIAAGDASHQLHDLQSGCVQIMTGAEVPDNADAVIPFEDIDVTETEARLKSGKPVIAGQNIHARGIDRRGGDSLLVPGCILDAPRIAILAATGHAKVRVAKLPRAFVISTGSEIVPVDHPDIRAGQSRASNLAGMAAGLRQIGLRDITTTHVVDDAAAIQRTVDHALAHADLLLISGGVSKGNFDHVPGALAAAGISKIFHGVAQRPGKPLWFGVTDSCRVFGLPGNPVSTLTVFRRYVVPFVRQSLGVAMAAPVTVTLGKNLSPHPKLTQLLPVHRCGDRVEALEYHGSGDLTALGASDGFVQIEPGEIQPTGQFFSWVI